MKQLLVVCSFLLLMSCSPKIDENFIKENESELLSIAQESLKSKTETFDGKGDDEISNRIKKLGVNKIEVKYKVQSNDFIGDDSLIYFSIDNESIFEPTKYLVYDFSKIPRKWGNEENIGAAYNRKQVSDRWYYETIGFD